MVQMKSFRLAALPTLLLLLCPATLRAQKTDPKLEELAAKLVARAGEKLPSAGSRGQWPCEVMDFQEEDGNVSRLEAQLAGEFSQALADKAPVLTVRHGSGTSEGMKPTASEGLQQILQAETHTLQQVPGARFILTGEIAKQPESLNLKVHLRSASGELLAEAAQRLARTPDRRALEKLPRQEEAPPETGAPLMLPASRIASGSNPLAAGSPSAAPKSEASSTGPPACANCGQAAASLPGSAPESPARHKSFVASPECLYCPSPTYPEAANRDRTEGTVLLAVTIAKDGSVQDVQVTRGLPDGLTEAAVAAVKNWRFEPLLGPDGNPVVVRTAVEVSFRLQHK